ncbi:MAG: ATP-dependent RecD-like DNA helicase [Lachnospiraceae bacterium]|nr:ATP-dependent RecD-like DNA helicase [Lachnospiraceae bacterium]
MTSISGYVEHVIYRNPENGYAVMEVSARERTLTLVGSLFYINEGEYVEATGRLTEHPLYGEQLQVTAAEVKQPQDVASIERYLGSGAVKGIGPALAGRIVDKFGEDTFRIMEEEPERLAEIRGISEKMAVKIAESTISQRDRRQAVIFLQQVGIGLNLALKIYETYKDEIYSIIRTNPYRLADDISGVGFKIADNIAVRSGIEADSDFRIRSGLLFVMNQAGTLGHTYLPVEDLIRNTGYLLGIEMPQIDEFLVNLVIDKKLVVKEEDGEKRVYLTYYYYAEMEVAKRLHDLNLPYKEDEEVLESRLRGIEGELEIKLEAKQREAFMGAVCSGLMVVTGGPGTGKTTIIRSIIRYFEEEEYAVVLAAPTGRAAKRMTETTGCEAKTIHRLLEINRMDGDDAGTAFFERNEQNPLEADVIIIDEMSMVDIHLMNALLKAVAVGARLILAGDVDQLPSVGPGNVLKDIILSECFPVVRLEKIFRQAAMSDIIVNAHKINAGEYVNPAARSRDFLFIRGTSPQSVIASCVALVKDKLPRYVHARTEEIQILTPMRKGPLGVDKLNEVLQAQLNPPAPSKREKEIGGTIYRVGDKVMQVKNNYKLEWEIRGRGTCVIESGAGVFNGDTGIIRSLNTFSEELEVEYEEGRMVTYGFKMLDELELAYAVTVHKSQGSEYPAVVLPLLSGPSMLMSRNLLYTAVTRAKSCVCIVGMPDTFASMIANDKKMKRYTGLERRIREAGGGLLSV